MLTGRDVGPRKATLVERCNFAVSEVDDHRPKGLLCIFSVDVDCSFVGSWRCRSSFCVSRAVADGGAPAEAHKDKSKNHGWEIVRIPMPPREFCRLNVRGKRPTSAEGLSIYFETGSATPYRFNPSSHAWPPPE